ncbi:MAG: SpoIID/LytB domain-containing protein [Nodosilinea sp. LVE1205-7]
MTLSLWSSLPAPVKASSLLLLRCTLGFCVVWGGSVQAAVQMRVAIAAAQAQVSLGSSTAAVVKNSQGQSLGQIPQGQSLTVTSDHDQLHLGAFQGQALWVEPSNNGQILINNRGYRGRVLVVPQENRVTAVNWVDLEAYLYSVLGGEMPTSWPQEALKAQAVAARSYALYQRERNRTNLYDVDSNTDSQVYRGLATEATSTIAAVDATRGQVLTYRGQVIEAVFHASSGGMTENVEDIWPQALPYLRSVPDFDQNSPVFRWSQTFSMGEFQQRVPGLGRLVGVLNPRTTPQGRVLSVELQGAEGQRRFSGTELRQALGLKSNLFTITTVGDTVQVEGRGYGHGLGLSQWGARNLALGGYRYFQILAHYYQGTVLSYIQIARRS